MTRVTIAGVTGWVGKPLAQVVQEAADLELVAAVARRDAGRQLGGIRISGSVREALATPSDVFVDYTSAASVKENVVAAIGAGLHVVIGSSGLTQEDFAEIDALESLQKSRGDREVSNRNHPDSGRPGQPSKRRSMWRTGRSSTPPYAGKMDAPSGMARELAWRLSEVRKPDLEVPIEGTVGQTEARGADVHGSRVHSIRL